MGKGEYLIHKSCGRIKTFASLSTSLVSGLGSNTFVSSVYPHPVITASLPGTELYHRILPEGKYLQSVHIAL